MVSVDLIMNELSVCNIFLENNMFSFRYVLNAAHCSKKYFKRIGEDIIRLGEWNEVNTNVYNKNTCTYYNAISKRQCLAGGPKCSQRNCNQGNAKKDCTKVKAGGGLLCAPDHQVHYKFFVRYSCSNIDFRISKLSERSFTQVMEKQELALL